MIPPLIFWNRILFLDQVVVIVAFFKESVLDACNLVVFPILFCYLSNTYFVILKWVVRNMVSYMSVVCIAKQVTGVSIGILPLR